MVKWSHIPLVTYHALLPYCTLHTYTIVRLIHTPLSVRVNFQQNKVQNQSTKTNKQKNIHVPIVHSPHLYHSHAYPIFIHTPLSVSPNTRAEYPNTSMHVKMCTLVTDNCSHSKSCIRIKLYYEDTIQNMWLRERCSQTVVLRMMFYPSPPTICPKCHIYPKCPHNPAMPCMKLISRDSLCSQLPPNAQTAPHLVDISLKKTKKYTHAHTQI
jgi:hypothetical protein